MTEHTMPKVLTPYGEVARIVGCGWVRIDHATGAHVPMVRVLSGPRFRWDSSYPLADLTIVR